MKFYAKSTLAILHNSRPSCLIALNLILPYTPDKGSSQRIKIIGSGIHTGSHRNNRALIESLATSGGSATYGWAGMLSWFIVKHIDCMVHTYSQSPI